PAGFGSYAHTRCGVSAARRRHASGCGRASMVRACGQRNARVRPPRHASPMGRRPRRPESLLQGPFTVAMAEREGVSRRALCGPSWVRVFGDVYVADGVTLDDAGRLEALRLAMPADAVAVGLT